MGDLDFRMGLLKALSEAVQGVIRGGWMRELEYREEDFRIRWQDDGTGSVERLDRYGLGTEILRFQVEVTCSAVEPVEPATNQPTGFVFRKPWKSIPAGWFVRAKADGPWFEIVDTGRLDSATQAVTLKGLRTFAYDPNATVTCRRGSLAPTSVQAALEALGEGVEILDDRTELS